jgi:hypothetical protein
MIRRTSGFINGKGVLDTMGADSPSLSMRAAPSLFILGWISAITGYFSVLSEDIAGLLAILAWTAAFILILLDRMAKYRADVRPLQNEWKDEEAENESSETEPMVNPRELGLDIPL